MNFMQREAAGDTPFDDDVFIGYLGVIYKNRGFPELISRMTVEQLLYETESSDLAEIQQADLVDGGMPLIQTTN